MAANVNGRRVAINSIVIKFTSTHYMTLCAMQHELNENLFKYVLLTFKIFIRLFFSLYDQNLIFLNEMGNGSACML